MSNYIPDLAQSTLELANQVIAVGKQVKDSVLEYRRKLVAIRNELAEIKQALKLADELVAEPIDTSSLQVQPTRVELPVIARLEDTCQEPSQPTVEVWPDIERLEVSTSEPSPLPEQRRSDLPVIQKIREREWVDPSPLPRYEPVAIERIEDEIPEPPSPGRVELLSIDRIPALATLETDIAPLEFVLNYQAQQPIDELPSPLDDSDYWTSRAEALGLATNEQVDRALDFAQMQRAYDHVAYTVIDAMERGRGSLTGAMVRSILTNQRANIYGSDDVPEFSGIDEVTSAIINNIYVQMSNEQDDQPPPALRVEDAFWNWFNDLGFTDFLEYLTLAEDDLPEEDME